MRLYDRLYVETDDACAICGVRRSEWLTVHHIDGNPSHDDYDNKIVLCCNCHQQHHQDKGLTRQQIEDRKRHLIEKTLTQFGVNAMKIAARNGFGVVAMPFLLYHLVGLGYMEQKESQMGDGSQEDATARFAMTSNGLRLLQRWFPPSN
jgi:hypothetical protein